MCANRSSAEWNSRIPDLRMICSFSASTTSTSSGSSAPLSTTALAKASSASQAVRPSAALTSSSRPSSSRSMRMLGLLDTWVTMPCSNSPSSSWPGSG